jgi:ribosomal protein S27E
VSRSVVSCKWCRRSLLHVSGDEPKRQMRPCLGVRPVYREDGRVDVRCPDCNEVNVFRWRLPPHDRLGVITR